MRNFGWRDLLIVFLLFLAVCALSLSLGAYPVLTGLRRGDPLSLNILLHLRLPRMLLALLVGSALSLSGASLQTLLRNPLADPFVLGVSSGSALGMLSSLLLGFSPFSPFTFLLTFFGGCVTALIVYAMGRSSSTFDTHRMLLAGVIINAFFGSFILVGLSHVHHSRLMGYVQWMMGNIAGATLHQVYILLPLIILGSLPLLLLLRPLDLFSLGEEMASSSGVNVQALKAATFLCASLLTAATVAFVGIIGFVGLIIPNMCRRWWGNHHATLFGTSILLGGVFLVAADTLGRLFPGGNLPIGAVTAIIGAPIFLLLLGRER